MENFLFLDERVKLGRLDTPIQFLPRLSSHYDCEIYVKRDDLTGIGLSGNKVRKLEYLLYQAEKEGADTVITGGGPQSNHCRATAVACRMRGLNPVLVLLNPRPPEYDGNLLLDKILGADLRFVDSGDFYSESDSLMEEVAEGLKKEGKKPYCIPIGGSNAIGYRGYFRTGLEIQKQEEEMRLRFDTVVCSVGTAGTLGGLVLAKLLGGWDRDLVGVNVTLNAEYFEERIPQIINLFAKEHNLEINGTEKAFRMIDGFVGPGYAISTEDEMGQIVKLAREEGLFLDPVYTGKAFWGMEAMLRDGRIKKGSKVLFMHTGGVFGIFPDKKSWEKFLL